MGTPDEVGFCPPIYPMRHVALAVQYNPPASPQFLRLPALTAVKGSELFPWDSEGETLLRKRDRERKSA
jgi:hypothetical protein